jgi:micrococcal nuclease
LIVVVLVSSLSLSQSEKEDLSAQLLGLYFTTTTEQHVLSENSERISVKRVIDGDTIVVVQGSKQEKVRLLGVDTPESVDPRKKVECFSKEAALYLKDVSLGKEVKLQSDETQQLKDKYGRLLRYVFLEDGRMLNLLLIQDGYAYEYTYDLPYTYQETFKKAQFQAMTEKKGLWSDATCGGKR